MKERDFADLTSEERMYVSDMYLKLQHIISDFERSMYEVHRIDPKSVRLCLKLMAGAILRIEKKMGEIMDSLRQRMMDYLLEGQLLDSDVSEEITVNLMDVVSWWLEDVSDSIHEESPRDDVFAILREEMGSVKTIEI